MAPKVSVIVAVYNAEKTLRRCLDSLLAQSLEAFEAIVVDDGSTDASSTICAEYSQRDSRFKVFHKKNEGVSATRQFGLNKASGEYVIHLDADDFIGPHSYEKAYNKAIEDHADIVFFDILRIESENTFTILNCPVKSWSHEVVLDAMIYKAFGSLCNRLVKRGLFAKYGIAFPEKMQYLEDKLMMIRLLARSFNARDYLTISYVPKTYLFYDTTANDSSLTKVSSVHKFEFRMNYWIAIGEEIDLKVFGKTYYTLLSEYAFNVLWNHNLTDFEFKERLGPYIQNIKKYVPFGIKKFFTLGVYSEGQAFVKRYKVLAYPLILSDKLQFSLNHLKAKRIYKRLKNSGDIPS